MYSHNELYICSLGSNKYYYQWQPLGAFIGIDIRKFVLSEMQWQCTAVQYAPSYKSQPFRDRRFDNIDMFTY